MATLGVHFDRASEIQEEPLFPQDVQDTLRATQRIDQKLRTAIQSLEVSDPNRQLKMFPSVQAHLDQFAKHLQFLHDSDQKGGLDPASSVKISHFQQSYDDMYDIFESIKQKKNALTGKGIFGRQQDEGEGECSIGFVSEESDSAKSERELIQETRERMNTADQQADIIIEQMMDMKETLDDQRRNLEDARKNAEALGSDHIEYISSLVQAIRAKKTNDVYLLALIISFFSFVTIVYWLSQTSGGD